MDNDIRLSSPAVCFNIKLFNKLNRDSLVSRGGDDPGTVDVVGVDGGIVGGREVAARDGTSEGETISAGHCDLGVDQREANIAHRVVRHKVYIETIAGCLE